MWREYVDVGIVGIAACANGNNIDVMATLCTMRYRYYWQEIILSAEGET